MRDESEGAREEDASVFNLSSRVVVTPFIPPESRVALVGSGERSSSVWGRLVPGCLADNQVGMPGRQRSGLQLLRVTRREVMAGKQKQMKHPGRGCEREGGGGHAWKTEESHHYTEMKSVCGSWVNWGMWEAEKNQDGMGPQETLHWGKGKRCSVVSEATA